MQPDLAIFPQVTVYAMLAISLLAAYGDVRDYRIPNYLNLALVALYPVYVAGAGGQVAWTLSIGLAAAVFAAGALLFSFNVLGGGDVKFMAAISLWAGPAHIVDFLFTSALVGGLLALILVTPVRHALALAFDAIGQVRLREVVLANVIPYGLAIAAGGALVAFRLLQG